MSAYFKSFLGFSAMCENCGAQPKFGSFEYCSRACAAEAEKKKRVASQQTGASGPPNTAAPSTSASYRASASADTNMCENCCVRSKSQETHEDGTVITHPYCGVGCTLASNRSIAPASNIPAPAAAPLGRNPSRIMMEHISTPIGRSILRMLQERWNSEELGTPNLKCLYGIDLSGQVYRRFDLALQLNDARPVMTTYYGGAITCNIADGGDQAPCESESCGVCDVLRSSFGTIPYGASSREGAYGLGLYTYRNPALAHHVATADGGQRARESSSYVLIQCRVVTQENSRESSKSLAGFIDDSGVVFCAQSMAVIPTHLLIYRLDAPSRFQHPVHSVNPTMVPLGQGVPPANPTSGGTGHPQFSRNGVNNSRSGEIKSTPMTKSGTRTTLTGASSSNMPPAPSNANAIPDPGAMEVDPDPSATRHSPQSRGQRTTNTGKGPAALPISPTPALQRGLPNTPVVAPSAVKPVSGDDPQCTPLPPSPAPTPALLSGPAYLSAAQQKALPDYRKGINAPMEPAVPAISSLPANRGLPNTPTMAPNGIKPAAEGDPRCTPLPPSPRPTPAPSSGSASLAPAQEKAPLERRGTANTTAGPAGMSHGLNKGTPNTPTVARSAPRSVADGDPRSTPRALPPSPAPTPALRVPSSNTQHASWSMNAAIQDSESMEVDDAFAIGGTPQSQPRQTTYTREELAVMPARGEDPQSTPPPPSPGPTPVSYPRVTRLFAARDFGKSSEKGRGRR